MAGTFAALRRELNARLSAEEIERDEEGRAVIGMTVRDDREFLSDLSANGRPTISSEVAEFIERGAMQYPPKERLCLHVRSDCIDEKEQNVYRGAIAEYYRLQYRQDVRDLRRNLFVSLAMTLAGVIALVVTLVVAYLSSNAILSEMLDIVAWVFLWEAVDQFFLERSLLRMRRNRCLALISMRVVFSSGTEAEERPAQ